MLEDIAALKGSLDEAQDELQRRSEARRKLEQVAEHHRNMSNECASLRTEIATLGVHLPRLREEQEELRAEVRRLAEERLSLENRHQRLTGELEAGKEKE